MAPRLPAPVTRRRCRPALAAGVVAVVATATVATAAPTLARPDYEMPFPCGEQWTGTTRSTHRPSALSVDFNRPGDLGALVVASAPGVVSRVADSGSSSYGKWIVVDHGDGWQSLHAHLKAQWVRTGQVVDQGMALGLVGESGGVSGAHLHFEEKYDGDVVRPSFSGTTFTFGTTLASGNCPDVPLAGDWDGDRTDQVAVFRRTPSGSFLLAGTDGSVSTVTFGRGSDTPVTGDWDGDQVTEVGVRRQRGRAFFLRKDDGTSTRVKIGRITDLPVTGDWDGSGTTDVGVWRPGAHAFRLLRADGTQQVVRLGTVGSIPVTGDWDGDGVTDLGVFDAATATFTLRTVAGGTASTSTVPLGTATDLPVTGDWNGDGVTDLGVWTPATATYTLRTTPVPGLRRARVTALVFGQPR